MRRSPATRRFGRRMAAVTAGLTIFGMVVSSTAAHATKPVPHPQVAPLSSVPLAMSDDLLRIVAGSGASLPLTLITGDRVHVGIDANGKPVVRDIEIAKRPDGRTVAFHTITRQGRVHVVPNDALSLLGSGLLDWGLFDLAKLAAHVAAGTVGEVPVLVTYTEQTAAQHAPKAAGTTTERTLPSVNGRSMSIAGDGRWWQEVRGKSGPGAVTVARSAGSLAGVEKVWLNELATISLDESVPQIGAPVAWQRGFDGTGVTVAVLDSGIDPNHPDVAGKIVEQVDFTGGPAGTKDEHGHGTHVAATILGTGAASGGLRKGVAPGAKLLVGRVCGATGTCAVDDIIAGMEWAAASEAKVVNISIGGSPTDGTDPMSEALNHLSRTTGTLFVVAAGNSGPNSETVNTPGVADEALTVAAVNKDDEMADFSSRGPRVGDGAAKPDIAAPGVDVVAARAAGTAMGTPVDDHYTTASGTSMATPHVTGAAAIIAQKHPDLPGSEIKALLMGTATDLGHDVYAQGAGRLNVATAVDPTIIASGSLNFGRLTYPHSPLTRTVTYTNHTDEPLTLHLTASAAVGEQTAPAGLFELDTDRVVVPANGSAQATLTVDGRVLGTDGAFGRYVGLVSAHDDTGALRATTRISAFLEPERFSLTVRVVPPKGATTVRYGDAIIMPVDDKVLLHDGPLTMDGADSMSAALFGGVYSAAVAVEWQDATGDWHQAIPVAAEVKLSEATTVTLDLRKVKPVKVSTPTATETYDAASSFERVSATGEWSMTGELTAGYGAKEPNWWALPTQPVRTGSLTFTTRAVLVTPTVTMKVTGAGPSFQLPARYHTPDVSVAGGAQRWPEGDTTAQRDIQLLVPRLATKGRLSVVHAGTGSAAEFAKVNARGKLVLLTPTDICATDCEFEPLRERVAAAAAAGAVGVLVASPGLTTLGNVPQRTIDCPEGPASCPAVEPYAALPIVTVDHGQATELIARLTRHPRANVQIHLGGSVLPTPYAVDFGNDGRVPGDLPYRVGQRDFGQVEHHLHADRPGEVTNLTWRQHTKSRPAGAALMLPRVATQQKLTTFVLRQRDAIDQFAAAWAEYAAPSALGQIGSESQEVVLGTKTTLHWNTGPTVPGAVSPVRTKSGFTVETGTLCSGCRQGDSFYPTLYLTGSGGSRQALIGMINDTGFAQFFFGIVGCEAPACDFSLADESGKEFERRLVPVSFGLGSAPRGARPDLVSGGRR